MVDTIKRAMGYADDVVQPSRQSDLSGVAIERRSMQTESANFHIADSLALAMWREGKIYLEILPAIHDTPKALQVTNAAGDVSTHYVTQAAEDGSVPLVEGAEDRKHHRLDVGRYGVTVAVGPTYTTKVEEESDFLTQILGGDPALVTSFLDLVFKLRGYPELEARAKLLVPAPVQQAQQGAGGQAALAAQAQQALAENQMLKAQLANVIEEQRADILKLRNNIELQTMKSQTSIIVADIEAKTKQTLATLDARMKAIETMWDKLQEAGRGTAP
jgi:Phage P22-like portal protein